MPYSNYPHGFAHGLAINEVPMVITPSPKANKFWVNNSSQNASDGNTGTNQYPLATLAKALTLVKADQGDLIMIGSGHAESINVGTTILTNGINIVGVGDGENRPVITFVTSFAAALAVNGNSISIQNIVFKCGVASQTVMMEINGANCHIYNCTFEEGANSAQTLVSINGASNNDCNNTIIEKCYLYAPTPSYTNQGLYIAKIHDNIQLINNFIYGEFSVGGINTANVIITHLQISGNIVYNLESTKAAINLANSSITGSGVDNRVYGNGASPLIVSASVVWIGNIGNDVTGTGGYIVPTAGTAATAIGTEFTITKTVTSSTIPNNTQTLALTGASSGTLLVEVINCQTDTPGFVAPTNIEFSTDNAKGVTGANGPVAVAALAVFGANKTYTSDVDGTVKKFPFVLESGKKIFIHGDDAAGTGAGTGDITIKFQRLTADATIAAA